MQFDYRLHKMNFVISALFLSVFSVKLGESLHNPIAPNDTVQNEQIKKCAVEFSVYHECMDKVESRSASHKADRDKKFNEMIQKCYKDKKCVAPKAVDAQASADSNQTKVCHEAIRKIKREKVRACVREKYPGYVFPKPRDHGHDYSPKNESIPEGCVQAEAVQKCKDDLHQRRREYEFLIMCGHKGLCGAKISKDCKDQLKLINKRICKCKKLVKKEIDAIRANETKCKDVKFKEHNQDNTTCYYGGYCREGLDVWRRDHPRRNNQSPSFLRQLIQRNPADAPVRAKSESSPPPASSGSSGPSSAAPQGSSTPPASTKA